MVNSMAFFKKCLSTIVLICLLLVVFPTESDAIFYDGSYSFKLSETEKNNGVLYGFTVLNDGSFALIYDNQYICYYSKNFEFVYCLKLRNVQGMVVLYNYEEKVAFTFSRNEESYVIYLNSEQLSIEKLERVPLAYTEARHLSSKNCYDIVEHNRKYSINRYGVFDSIFNLKTNNFTITDAYGNVLFCRAENNNTMLNMLVFLSIMAIVVVVVIAGLFVVHKKGTKRNRDG